MISVVIPAHNEEGHLQACLAALLDGAPSGVLEVVVVANGCTDRTVDVARAVGPPVEVLELDVASKVAALNAGEAHVSRFPRLYLDADVRIRWRDVARIAEVLGDEGVLLAAPRGVWRTERRPWAVRSYLRLLAAMPQVRHSLTGGGVLAVSAAGRQRFGVFEEVLADDRFLEAQFAPSERRLVADATSMVETPYSVAALVRRRSRVVIGNAELVERGVITDSQRWQALAQALRARPALLVDLPAFLTITVAARWRARRLLRRDVVGWERDETTRTAR